MKLSFSCIAAFLVLLPASSIAADSTAPNHEAVVAPTEARENRRLGGRKNCSHNYSSFDKFKICLDGAISTCLKMTSKTNAEFADYDGTDDSFKFKLIQVTVAAGDRVRFENQEFDHNLAALDLDGNDGATAFKISQSSGPCDTNAKVKISYLDPTGNPSNDWLFVTSDSNTPKWKIESKDGSKFKLYAV